MTIADLRNLKPREPSPVAPAFSEEAFALAFSERYSADLRYVAKWGRWLVYEKGRWREDETVRVFGLTRTLVRDLVVRCEKDGLARKLASASTVSAVERLARSDKRHVGRVDQWDADPWLLNTPDGTVNLRSGLTRPHWRDDYLTKMTAVAPGGECPGFREFLRRITDGDTELELFIQRMLGYGLTGLTSEHALFFCWGTGANGKSTLLNTCAAIAGDYHRTAPVETFVDSHGSRHPTELAMLRGARLVTAIETEEGRHWAESKIKALTGGDRIAARFMRQDFFEFQPTFKLIIAGNHKPQLRNVDEAIRRRFHLIPFMVTIPPDERDDRLPEKLHAEWPGILAWMIEGAVEWGGLGLQAPEAVRTATDDYLTNEDALAEWLEDCCRTGPEYWAGNRDLYRSWKEWRETNGEPVGQKKRFLAALEDRSFVRERQPGTGARGFRGVLPIPPSGKDWV